MYGYYRQVIESGMSHVVVAILNCAVANDLEIPLRPFQLFLSESLLFRSLIESPAI